ncbi:hypothetical protein J2S43_003322 [Catenuloplanes nepalensis]|uniref:Lipoprotein n=1 Tax=Catenuloplanes nepalensis TaxID=587533 RepID=A0ABT9MTN7_9ACTN|nr:hypothetical protein [Catenuloplanes nepalensis]MDP9794810.1 hypothetical protein [Catenuloplanes nepalensis]
MRLPALLLSALLLTGCAAPRAPGPTVAQVVAEFHSTAGLLRDGSYRATFDVRLPERTVRWTGVMRTLGGVDAIWSVDGTASDEGRIIDAVSVVDAGGVRYLDSMTETFRGFEWVALHGDDRNTYYWRSGAAVPLPEVDPFVWLDVTGARTAVVARTMDGGVRYRLAGWTPGPDLTAALRRAELVADSPHTAFDLTLTAAGRPARLDVRMPGLTAQLVVTGTRVRERIKVPEEGQFVSLPGLL